MSDGFSEDEVIGFGTGARRRSPSRWLRRHPAVVVGLVVIAAAGGAAALVSYVRAAPRLPSLRTAAALSEPVGAASSEDAWDVAADGRPSAPVALSVTARLTFADVPADGVQVLGLAGPGITPPALALATVTPTSTGLTTVFRTDVDCTEVPLPVPVGAYGVRVRVASGSRRTTGTLAAGTLGASWGTHVGSACEAWLAGRDLTATAAETTVDGVLPRATVNLSVSNAGDRPAVARVVPDPAGGVAVESAPAGTVVLAPRATTRVALRVTLDQCDAVSTFPPTTATDTSTALRLYAAGGPTLDPADVRVIPDGFGPVGIPFAPSAAAEVSAALRSACGDLDPFVTLIPESAHYDTATRILSVPIVIDGTPGKVSAVRLVEATDGPRSAPFTALTRTTAWIPPDRTGQITTTLRYRETGRSACPVDGELLPGFALTARVPAPTGVRVLHYAPTLVPWDESPPLLALCHGAG